MPRRKKLFVNKHKDIGTPPGSLPDLVDSNKQSLQFPINKINYDQNIFKKYKLFNIHELEAEIHSIKESSTDLTHWIDINSLNDLNAIKVIGDNLNIHSLILEDITHTHQRPKFEDWDHFIYVVVKMIYLNDSHEIINEQVSFILGKNYLISFQEHDGGVFNIIRKRLEANKGRIRKMRADYLMYSLLDAIADNYFLVLDTINERLIHIEEEIEAKHDMEYIKELHELKQEILFIRRYTLPFKEMILSLMKEESDLIQDGTVIFLKDLQDHTIQILDSIDMMREISLSVLETSRSTLNNKMNEIMKLLTIISAIFIPVTFIAGIYGMNFKHMPELDYPWAYPATLLLMLAIIIGMIIYFKNKKWL